MMIVRPRTDATSYCKCPFCSGNWLPQVGLGEIVSGGYAIAIYNYWEVLELFCGLDVGFFCHCGDGLL